MKDAEIDASLQKRGVAE